MVSTVKQLALDTLAGEFNPDLKANLNEHLSICHSIQT